MYQEYLIPIALLTMRIWLGSIFIIQASDKLFNIGIQNVSDAFEFKISHFALSPNVYRYFAGLTSIIELNAGILILFGLFKVVALAALALNILLLSIAFSLNTPMWDMRHFLPRFLILLIVMFTSNQNDWFSIDWLMNK